MRARVFQENLCIKVGLPVLWKAVIGWGRVCRSVIGWSERRDVFDQAAALVNQEHVNSHSSLS